VNLLAHLHVYAPVFPTALHVPPFKHGLLAHGFEN
jgi:hypothetical protein